MSKRNVLSILVLTLFSVPALAENYPANHCEVFVRKVSARPSSHGSASFRAVVKVGWIGNDETIQRVGFYGREQVQDLGNSPDCHSGGYSSTDFRIIDGAVVNDGRVEYGEYVFDFKIATGSVVSQCPGYRFSSIGAFFVQTNKNTYWVNPEMDSSRYFHFDSNGYSSVSWKGGAYQDLYTDREDLRYYNPRGCR